MNTNPALCDNWDQHWTDFGQAAQDGPSNGWRRRLVMRLLGIHDDASVRMLEIGSGAGDFCAGLSGPV